MAAYSMDLRTRVLEDSDAGMRADAVAEKYRVSLSWVNRLTQRRRESGEIAPRRQIRWRTPILTPDLPRLETLIAEQPNRTLAELQQGVGDGREPDHDLARDRRAGHHHQKKRYARPNRIGPTSPPPGRTGDESPRRLTRPASCFSMNVGSRRTCCGALAGAAAARASTITRRTITGRPARSSGRCGSPA